MDAASLALQLHGRILRDLAVHDGRHFQGLRAAAAHLRREQKINNQVAKRLARLDDACAVMRHITVVSAEAFHRELFDQLSCTGNSDHHPTKQSAPTRLLDWVAKSSVAYFDLFSDDPVCSAFADTDPCVHTSASSSSLDNDICDNSGEFLPVPPFPLLRSQEIDMPEIDKPEIDMPEIAKSEEIDMPEIDMPEIAKEVDKPEIDMP